MQATQAPPERFNSWLIILLAPNKTTQLGNPSNTLVQGGWDGREDHGSVNCAVERLPLMGGKELLTRVVRVVARLIG
jgi:hypothetical protein